MRKMLLLCKRSKEAGVLKDCGCSLIGMVFLCSQAHELSSLTAIILPLPWSLTLKRRLHPLLHLLSSVSLPRSSYYRLHYTSRMAESLESPSFSHQTRYLQAHSQADRPSLLYYAHKSCRHLSLRCLLLLSFL